MYYVYVRQKGTTQDNMVGVDDCTTFAMLMKLLKKMKLVNMGVHKRETVVAYSWCITGWRINWTFTENSQCPVMDMMMTLREAGIKQSDRLVISDFCRYKGKGKVLKKVENNCGEVVWCYEEGMFDDGKLNGTGTRKLFSSSSDAKEHTGVFLDGTPVVHGVMIDST